MDYCELLAYLGGVVDSDGYLKIVKGYRSLRTSFRYYGITIGVQQLWPGRAVLHFADTFDGKVGLWPLPSGKQIARSEIHGRKAEAAARRLLPYLLVKRRQALVLLDVSRLNRKKGDRSPERYRQLEAAHEELVSLHEGSWIDDTRRASSSQSQKGYECMSPVQLGWTRRQVLAYLAGVMDSDGNFKIEKKHVPDMINPHYRICLRCAQVVPSPAVELLAQTFGGHLGVIKSRQANHRDLVSWSLNDRAAESAIRSLLPYLVVKTSEAYLLLELRRLKAQGKLGWTEWRHRNRWHASVRMRKRCYTAEQVAGFEQVHKAIQEVHSTGFGLLKKGRL